MSFLQTKYWAESKSRFGWTYDKVKFSYLLGGKSYSTEVFVLHRKIARFFSLSYIPLAPDFFNDCLQKDTSLEVFEVFFAFIKEVKKILVKNTLFLRFDLPANFPSLEEKNVFLQDFLMQAKKRQVALFKAKTDVQTPDTVLLNLELSEEQLLANMKSKWRYNIRLAEKKGVFIEEIGREGLDHFYNLYKETAKRDGIAIHSFAYYDALFANAFSYPEISLRLYIAKHENDILSSIICLFSKEEAVYLYGASANIKRNLMSTYLLQWKAIQDAKSFGSKCYDFYGIPPIEDAKHPMYGLYRFKTGFGGDIVHRIGSIDIRISLFYALFNIAETLRLFWFKKIKKLFVKKASL